MGNLFDRAYYRQKYDQNLRMAEQAQADNIRDVHLKLSEFYAVALAVADECEETKLLAASCGR